MRSGIDPTPPVLPPFPTAPASAMTPKYRSGKELPTPLSGNRCAKTFTATARCYISSSYLSAPRPLYPPLRACCNRFRKECGGMREPRAARRGSGAAGRSGRLGWEADLRRLSPVQLRPSARIEWHKPRRGRSDARLELPNQPQGSPGDHGSSSIEPFAD